MSNLGHVHRLGRIERTRKWIVQFEVSIAELRARPPDEGEHELVRKAQVDAMLSQVDDLREQVRVLEAGGDNCS